MKTTIQTTKGLYKQARESRSREFQETLQTIQTHAKALEESINPNIAHQYLLSMGKCLDRLKTITNMAYLNKLKDTCVNCNSQIFPHKCLETYVEGLCTFKCMCSCRI